MCAMCVSSAQFTLLRWIDINAELDAAGPQLSFDPIDQALYLGIAAMVARVTSDRAVVGEDAPTDMQVARLRDLRQDTTLCRYGNRREELSNRLLEAAIRAANESRAFATPTMRSVTALCLIELLVFSMGFLC